MATIGSLGVGSGLALNDLLEKISAAERAPLTAIKARQSAQNTKISAYGAIKSLLSSLKDTADKLASPSFMASVKSSSSANDVLTVSSGETAVAGSHTVVVSKLAQAQTLVAAGVADATTDIGAGAATLTISFGEVTGTLDAGTRKYNAGATFAPDPDKDAITVNIAAGASSLEDVRDAINEAADGAVVASIISDGTNQRLVMSTGATGATAGMKVAVAGANGALAALLEHDVTGAQSMETTVQAQDAALTVDGIAITSATNTVQEAMQGVTMTLLKDGTSTVKIERDETKVRGAIDDFVTGFNKLNTKIRELTAFNADKQVGAVLIGDSTARLIQSRVRGPLFESVSGAAAGSPGTLSQLGITFQKDGSLKMDSATLAAALEDDPEGVSYLFAGDETVDGLADEVSSVITGLTQDLDGEDEDGLLTVATSYAKKAVERLADDYERAEARIEAKVQIIRQQFVQLDSVISGMNATSSYLTTQFNMLAKQTQK